MVVFPNAKINLGLNILRRRPDGYHDIATVMVGIDWCDVLEVVPARGTCDKLTVTGREVECPPEKNLVMKALNALRKVINVPPVDIYLNKIIPDGAGLGGGSADAAFMLIATNKLFQLGLTDVALAEVAATVGSDCPFFIYNRPMLSTGRGEILAPVGGLYEALNDKCVVIVKPENCSVSTAEAYAGVTPRLRTATPMDVLCNPISDWKTTLANDFEDSIFARTERPAFIKKRLYEFGAEYAAMSGSGSAVFGIFAPDVADVVDFITEFPYDAVHKGYFILD